MNYAPMSTPAASKTTFRWKIVRNTRYTDENRILTRISSCLDYIESDHWHKKVSQGPSTQGQEERASPTISNGCHDNTRNLLQCTNFLFIFFFFIITFSRDGFSGLYKAPSSLSIDPAKHKYIENKRTLRWMTVADNCRDINRRAAEEGINNWKGVIVLCAVNRLQVSTRCQGYCITHEKVIRERRWWSTTNIWNRLEHIDLSTSCLVCVSFTLYLR